MPIDPRLLCQVSEPELINTVATAVENILRDLKLTGRADLLTTIVVKKVIDVANTGERDPERIRELVLRYVHPTP